MKRAQIMIVFVLAALGAVFVQSSADPTAATTTFTPVTDKTEVSNSAGDNFTTSAAIPTTTTNEITSAADGNATTNTVPISSTSAVSSSVGPTSTSFVSTGTSEVTTLSTTAPQTTAATTVCPPLSGFDGASFIGGIVLALGVIVILVIIVKCYQHHTRKNELQYSQF